MALDMHKGTCGIDSANICSFSSRQKLATAMCLSKNELFSKMKLCCVDTRHFKMAVKNGFEGVWSDFGMNLEKYKAGFVIYLQLPLGWRQQWSR